MILNIIQGGMSHGVLFQRLFCKIGENGKKQLFIMTHLVSTKLNLFYENSYVFELLNNKREIA